MKLVTREDAKADWWDSLGDRTWGAYLADIQKQAILKAHELSGEPANALDIGCGSGRWSKLLINLGWNVKCTEVREHALMRCREQNPAADCVLVDPGEGALPAASGSVRLLLCMEVPPVIHSGWFLDEAFRVLSGDGIMVGVFWNLFSYRGLLAHLTAPFRGSYDYYKVKYPVWKRQAMSHGFVLRHERGFCWFPFRRDSNSPSVPVFAQLEKNLGLRRLPAISPWVVLAAQKTRPMISSETAFE